MLVLTWLNPALQGGQPSLLHSPKLHVPQGKPGPPIALNIYQVPDILGYLVHEDRWPPTSYSVLQPRGGCLDTTPSPFQVSHTCPVRACTL